MVVAMKTTVKRLKGEPRADQDGMGGALPLQLPEVGPKQGGDGTKRRRGGLEEEGGVM